MPRGSGRENHNNGAELQKAAKDGKVDCARYVQPAPALFQESRIEEIRRRYRKERQREKTGDKDAGPEPAVRRIRGIRGNRAGVPGTIMTLAAA